ncbi:OmpH family outer membrane protein [Colwellia sp. KU-HH00111]|uniref:OmpH family outer membrane protein n=1 Tax=Colwellia sp. KU-HH00111 TaxID=3127652 RepID=UPI0031031877
MKKFIKSMAITATASTLLLAGSAMALEQKIAVVNVQEAISQIPQAATLMQTLEAEFKDEKAVIEQLQKDLTFEDENLKRNGSLMSEKEKTELQTKMAGLYQQYQVKVKEFQQKVSMRKNEETNKLLALVTQAVDNIAAKNGYDLVISKQAVVFSKPKTNITSKVVEQVSKLK